MKVFVGILGLCLLLSMVAARSPYESDDDDYDGGRDARQSNPAPFAYVPPSNSCTRVSFGNSFCGGFSRGNGGGCDAYCLQKGYPFSWCRRSYCLCHRGEDRGAECERN